MSTSERLTGPADVERFARPATPAGFDPSRASERAADPRGWRYDDAEREIVHRVIAERRDVRRFRPEAVPDDVLERVLAAAHRAPSVGLMQPWRLIVIRALDTRIAVRRLAQRERLRQAEHFDERTRQFLDQKIEGVVEAPLGVCVCCDHGDPDAEMLGRGTIPETDVYSTACAIENLWLAARAEGLGVGWVSFYRPDDLRALLGIPDARRSDRVPVPRLARRASRAARARGGRLVLPAGARRRRHGRALARGPRAQLERGPVATAAPVPIARPRSPRATASTSSSSRPAASARSRR